MFIFLPSCSYWIPCTGNNTQSSKYSCTCTHEWTQVEDKDRVYHTVLHAIYNIIYTITAMITNTFLCVYIHVHIICASTSTCYHVLVGNIIVNVFSLQYASMYNFVHSPTVYWQSSGVVHLHSFVTFHRCAEHNFDTIWWSIKTMLKLTA